ncbi:PAS domain S-box protein [Massilia scottii]|uniref:PAS domain S-box protein n=1 Tax=Massilia scottii TaxID=3057166 RepID=UPI002796B5BB|nr:PAS domain S-box protein [Massilia sp. CCM 9029]MDQ1834933.1 PAS domain S-box protein [Massilia sp. CCM 9029]
MLDAPVPADEGARMAALCGLNILDTPPEERFDRITRSAQRMFDCPIALVTLVDSERQWFKSRLGLDAPETPRNISFCGHAILRNFPFVIPDAAADPRFADNPLVLGPPHIRFYAGIPLRADNGALVATLCLIDRVPRGFSDDDIAALCDLAQWAELELNVYTIRQATRVSREKEARLRAIVEHAGDAIITIDDQGLVETFNPEAQRLFAYRPDQVIGAPFSVLIARHYRAAIGAYARALARDGMGDGVRINRQVVGQRSDGSRFPANLVASEMHINGRRAFTGLVRDISARRRNADEMKRLNRRLAETLSLQHAILNSSNYAIIYVNARGQVIMFNDGAQRMLGYSEAEMRTQSSLLVLHDPVELDARVHALSIELGRPIRPGAEVFIAKARERLPDESEWTYIRKDGSRLPVLLSISAVWDGENALSGFVGIAQDISERKKMENMKNEFISTVSHELRTPMTSIKGSLGLLAGGAGGEIPVRAKVLLDIASKNCDRLVRLINDILDVEKIESGNMRFEPVVQPLLPLVEHAIAATNAFASPFKVSFDLRSENGDLMVAADTDRLIQVIVNLLSNAAKFAPPGGVVEVRLLRQPGYARLSVADHGPGIPDQFRSRIFQKFAQADASDTRPKGGTGLGLNISKAIIERHRGRIDFLSECGVRTEFFFELPLAA